MRKLESLQFLRFLAFMLIFLFHSAHFQFLYNPGGGGAASAVSFFILLSGFLAGYGSIGHEIKCNLSTTLIYVSKKLKKFYPLYIITTAITLLYCGLKTYLLAGNHEMVFALLSQLAKNILLIQAWFPTGYFSFNSPSWFLSTMLFLYACKTPLICLCNKINTKSHGSFLLIGLLSILSILFGVYCYQIGQTTYSLEFWLYIFPPARLLEFTCGIICGILMHQVYFKFPNPNKIVCTLLELATFIIWYLVYQNQLMEWECRSLRWFLPNLLIICIFSLNAGYVSDLFSLKWLKHLGDISFESYLLHQVILTLCSYGVGFLAGYLGDIVYTPIWNALMQVGCLVGTLLLSRVVHFPGNRKHK